MADLTQQSLDLLNAEELACFLTEGCLIDGKPEFNDLTEEQLDHFMRQMRDYEV